MVNRINLKSSLIFTTRNRVVKFLLYLSLVIFMATMVNMLVVMLPSERHGDLSNELSHIKSSIMSSINDGKQQKIDLAILEEVNALEKKLGHSVTEVELHSNLLKLSRESNVSIVNQIYSSHTSNGVNVIDQEIILTGDYRGVREFIYGVHTLPSLSVIKEVRIDKENKERGNRLKSVISISTYFNHSSPKNRSRGV